MRAARGDGVRRWPSKFTDEDKNIWREFVTDLIKALGEAEYARGYKTGLADAKADEEVRKTKDARRYLMSK